MSIKMRFKRHFNNAWLISAAKEKFVDYPWLEEQIKSLVWCNVRDDDTTYFVDPWKRNEGYAWCDQESIILENTEQGPIELLIIQDNRIGGITLIEKVLDTYLYDLEMYPKELASIWQEHVLPELRDMYPENLWKGRFERVVAKCV